MKRKNYDRTMGGFRFRYVDGDYDYLLMKSLPYKLNKNNWNRALRFKEENERDYYRCEHDCTGSKKVRITLKRKRVCFYVYYYETLDV